MDRKVWLPSGGSLVIDRTEAMTVVDVNTGKFIGSGGNLEETVTRNNLEAAEEIVRQLRLRDIGGIIVVDFIDMVLESNRDLVLRRLLECLGRDRTKHQVAEVTSLGLVQMTRKRVGRACSRSFSETVRALQRPRLHHPRRAGRPRTVATARAAPRQRQPWRRQRATVAATTPAAVATTARRRRRARSRSRRGRGGREQGGPAQAEPAAAAPSGPTPAQIAAAAHQAALLASQAVADDDTLVEDGEVTSGAGLQDVEAAAVLDAVESQQPAAVQPPETAPQAQDSVEAEQEQPAQAEARAAGRRRRTGGDRTGRRASCGARDGRAETAPAPEEAAPRPPASPRSAAVASVPASSHRRVPPAARPAPRSASLLSRAPTT